MSVLDQKAPSYALRRKQAIGRIAYLSIAKFKRNKTMVAAFRFRPEKAAQMDHRPPNLYASAASYVRSSDRPQTRPNFLNEGYATTIALSVYSASPLIISM